MLTQVGWIERVAPRLARQLVSAAMGGVGWRVGLRCGAQTADR